MAHTFTCMDVRFLCDVTGETVMVPSRHRNTNDIYSQSKNQKRINNSFASNSVYNIMSLRELKSLWNDIEERSSTAKGPIEPSRYGLRRTKARSNDDGTVFTNQDIFRETPALYDLRRIVSGDDGPDGNLSAGNIGPNKAETLSSQKRKKEQEEDAKFVKRIKDSSASIARAYTCPLTGDLLYNPVMIEGDGSILYERKAIAEYIDKHTSGNLQCFIPSPVYDKIIGSAIIPAYQARNAIFHLVEIGILDNHLTDLWRDLMATKKESDGGNPRAMVDLAYILTDPDGDGGYSPSPDEEKKAYALWKRAADMGDVEGMCEAGEWLVEGTGVDRDEGLGIELIKIAANAGHANACLSMALDHSMGLNCLEKSNELTKQWARKALETNKPWPLDDSEREIAEKLLLIEEMEMHVGEENGEKYR